MLIFLIKQKNKKFWKHAIYLTITFIIIFVCLYLESDSIVKTRINIIVNDIKIATTRNEKSTIGSNRIEIWKATISVIKKKPILGVGTDNLKQGLTELNTKETTNVINTYGRIPFDKAHNEYLHILATIGIPALIIYLIFICKILLKNIKKVFKDFKVFVITASILCYMIQAFFNISTIGIAPLFWFALGLLDSKNNV